MFIRERREPVSAGKFKLAGEHSCERREEWDGQAGCGLENVQEARWSRR